MSLVCRYLESQTEKWRNDQVAKFAAIKGCFSKQECEQIIAIGKYLQAIDGKISSSGVKAGDWETEHKIRKSVVRCLPPTSETEWIFAKMEKVVEFANQHFRYDLYGFERFQYASYTEGGHYNWHIDLGPGQESSRKLSISLQLSNPADYQGGQLEFVGETSAGDNDQGSVIIFPSFLGHRVTPVLSGIRHAIVAWVHGPAFR